jgi:hypothetical protein
VPPRQADKAMRVQSTRLRTRLRLRPPGLLRSDWRRAQRLLPSPIGAGYGSIKPDSVPGRSYRPAEQREMDRLIGTQR